jgi:hypothetical protein
LNERKKERNEELTYVVETGVEDHKKVWSGGRRDLLDQQKASRSNERAVHSVVEDLKSTY